MKRHCFILRSIEEGEIQHILCINMYECVVTDAKAYHRMKYQTFTVQKVYLI